MRTRVPVAGTSVPARQALPARGRRLPRVPRLCQPCGETVASRTPIALLFLLPLYCLGLLPFARAAWVADARAVPADVANTAPISGPRELLDLLGVEESHFRGLRDGRPLVLDEQQHLLRFLYAVRRFAPANTERWARPAGDLLSAEGNGDDADDLQGKLFQLAGRVTLVNVERPVPEVVERLEMEEYYRCALELDGGGTATVYATAVPRDWPREQPFSERASVPALFLKWTVVEPERSEPVFAAARVAWHPNTVLGDLGMDVGLFDDVQNAADLLARDRECFYQLLAAAGRADNAELLRLAAQAAPPGDAPAPPDYSVVPLFNDAARQHGKLFAFSGTVVRAVEVRVDDADVRSRFGIDHYYQLDLMTPDSQDNPLVFCVRELPEGMPRGPDARSKVRLTGFFFKTWSYRQQRLEADQEPLRQLAPMLIGRSAVWFPPPGADRNVPAQVAAATLFLLALAGVAVALWRRRRGDRQLRARLKSLRPPAQQPSLDSLGLETQDRPDFRGL